MYFFLDTHCRTKSHEKSEERISEMRQRYIVDEIQQQLPKKKTFKKQE